MVHLKESVPYPNNKHVVFNNANKVAVDDGDHCTCITTSVSATDEFQHRCYRPVPMPVSVMSSNAKVSPMSFNAKVPPMSFDAEVSPMSFDAEVPAMSSDAEVPAINSNASVSAINFNPELPLVIPAWVEYSYFRATSTCKDTSHSF